MIYFSIKDIFLAILAFVILGALSSLLYFFLSSLKKEGRLNINTVKALFFSSPEECKALVFKNTIREAAPPGHLFEFCFTIFTGVFYILTSYVFLDGLFRLAYLLFFLLGFIYTGKLLSRLREPFLSATRKLLGWIFYIFVLVTYPVRRALGVIFRMLFAIIRTTFISLFQFFKKMLIKSRFTNN